MTLIKTPESKSPEVVSRIQANAELLANWVREYLHRGHGVRDSVVLALKSAGVYHLATEDGIERACALFQREVDRLTEAADEGRRLIRGVPTNISARNPRKIVGEDLPMPAPPSPLVVKGG